MLIGLTPKDARQANEAIRYHQRHKNDGPLPAGRRRRTAGGGGSIHKAYCKNAAGAATTIVCFKDTDTTGDEITVNCTIVGGTYLNDCAPRLVDGTPIDVVYRNGQWDCIWPFIGGQDC